MNSHDVDYKIVGADIQAVEIELDPSETVIAEAGAMCWMDDGIAFEAKAGDGSNMDEGFFSKAFSMGKRVLTGESLFMTHFTNEGSGKKSVTFNAPYPGKIIPLDLAKTGKIICQKDSFLCAARGTKIDISFSKKLGAGLFGGEGFILQSLEGDGNAFIHAGGAVVEKELNGEKLIVDTGCLVGFSEGIEYDIQRAGNLKSMLFGGESLFLATLQGHGKVYLQSLPFSKLADRVLQNASVEVGESSTKAGNDSMLGGLSNMFER
jgi:uncharacterized protein (TIGR00266 family)